MPCFTTPKQLHDTAQYRITGWWPPGRETCRPACVETCEAKSFQLTVCCLTHIALNIGITPACPTLATRWLTSLAGAGFSPAEIFNLTRPYSPYSALNFSACIEPTAPLDDNTPAGNSVRCNSVDVFILVAWCRTPALKGNAF